MKWSLVLYVFSTQQHLFLNKDKYVGLWAIRFFLKLTKAVSGWSLQCNVLWRHLLSNSCSKPDAVQCSSKWNGVTDLLRSALPEPGYPYSCQTMLIPLHPFKAKLRNQNIRFHPWQHRIIEQYSSPNTSYSVPSFYLSFVMFYRRKLCFIMYIHHFKKLNLCHHLAVP